MSEQGRGRSALPLLGAAMALGVLGDLLLRAEPWGLNVLLWTGAVLGTGIVWARRERFPWTGAQPALAFTGLLFSAALAWRDSPGLNVLSVFAILGIVLLFNLPVWVPRMRRALLGEYVAAALGMVTSIAIGFLSLVSNDATREITGGSAWKRGVAIGRGLLLAVPVVVLFGVLLIAADPAFEAIAKDLLRIDFAELLSHVFWTGFLAWTTGGILREAFRQRERAPVRLGRPPFSLGIVEVGIVLGLLDLLFAAFVVVQIRYLFGGAPLVEVTPGLTYAQYARRGFFELVAVAALVLPLLWITDSVLLEERARARNVYRVLAAALIALVAVVMASAVQRLRLYQAEFGWTEQRLYASVFMGWLAIVFAWFAATVLGGDRRRFVFGAGAAGLVALALMHLLNPDGFIVRSHAGRAAAGHSVDVTYVVSLSDDAVPALLAALPRLGPEDRCRLAARLLDRRSAARPHDWRTWNWSRARARRLLDEAQPQLREMAC